MVAPFFDAPRYPGPSYNLSKSIQKNPVPQQSHKNKNRKKTTKKKRDLIRDDGDIIHTSSAGHTIHGPCISCTSQLGGWSIVIVQCDDQHSSTDLTKKTRRSWIPDVDMYISFYPYIYIYTYNEDYWWGRIFCLELATNFTKKGSTVVCVFGWGGYVTVVSSIHSREHCEAHMECNISSSLALICQKK